MPDPVEVILADLVGSLGCESGVIVVRDGTTGERTILASAGLPEVAVAGLAAALRDPDHPITRTFAEPAASFDVRPTRPGGPKLRGHVPLLVEPGGRAEVVGVLALAYERPMDERSQKEVEAAAARMAAAVDASR